MVQNMNQLDGGRPVAAGTQPPARRSGGSLAQLRTIGVVLILVAGLLVGGCGKKDSSTAGSGGGTETTARVRAPKTKFVLHAGLAFGAFHRYVYKPFKAGTFEKGAKGRIRASLKAGLAGAFIYHELKLALNAAQADPKLSKLAAPITALQNRMKKTAAGVKSGQTTPQDIEGANTDLEKLRTDSSAAGAQVQDQEPSSLSTSGH